MRIISFVNQKGGVGKTTSVLNIGAGIAKKGKKVLLIDIDPQASLTYSLGIDGETVENTIYDVLKQTKNIESTILKISENLDIIPSNIELSGADMELAGVAGREFLLKAALKNIPNYDYVLIDCPPNLAVLTLNALTASEKVYVPIQTQYLAMKGLSLLLDTVRIVIERLNDSLKIGGIICTMYDGRNNLSKQVVETIKSHFSELLFETKIRNNVALAEAPSFGKHIYDYKNNSVGAEDYNNLCIEIIEREGV
jgi:chromosome partitioning protein